MGADTHAVHGGVAIGVVGAGAMGAGIAQVAALAGQRVLLFDTRVGAAQTAIDGIQTVVDKLEAKGRVTSDQVTSVRSGLGAVDALSDFAECGLVIEAIVEDLEAKQSLFRFLEDVVATNALLATNTSSISITAIAAALKHPERLAGMHFFNPAPLMPLVEVISGAATSKSALESIHATATKWGKIPVFAKSSPGFIVNRVARSFYAESLRVLGEGGASCATIDAVMREAGGFRMGPFELMDLIGHDVNYAVTCSVFEAFYGDTRFTPSLLQKDLVSAGFLGRKSGRGFYVYGEEAPAIVASTHRPEAVPGHIRLYAGSLLSGVLADRLTLAGIPFLRAEAHPDLRIAECAGCILYQCDGRTATDRAKTLGIDDTVLVDLTLNAATASRLAMTAAAQSSSSAPAAAAGLLQAGGFAVSEIGDVPGMIVLRTVAMLANEAADAVNQGVCSASDCDLAMRKGVNFPIGPLQWAEAIGIGFVVASLDNLREAYGEQRYRVSPLLRKLAASGKGFSPQNEPPHI